MFPWLRPVSNTCQPQVSQQTRYTLDTHQDLDSRFRLEYVLGLGLLPRQHFAIGVDEVDALKLEHDARHQERFHELHKDYVSISSVGIQRPVSRTDALVFGEISPPSEQSVLDCRELRARGRHSVVQDESCLDKGGIAGRKQRRHALVVLSDTTVPRVGGWSRSSAAEIRSACPLPLR